MPRTPDRQPGSSDEEATLYETNPTGLATAGGVWFNGTSFQMRDAAGVFDPRELTSAQHSALRQLIHFIDEGPAEGFASGAYKAILPVGAPFPTSVIWWESSAQTQKIVEQTITRNSFNVPSQVQWKMYDTDGTTVLITVTDSIVYVNNVFETERTRTIV